MIASYKLLLVHYFCTSYITCTKLQLVHDIYMYYITLQYINETFLLYLTNTEFLCANIVFVNSFLQVISHHFVIVWNQCNISWHNVSYVSCLGNIPHYKVINSLKNKIIVRITRHKRQWNRYISHLGPSLNGNGRALIAITPLTSKQY